MLNRDAFDYRFLQTTAHRPWPLPERPWIMTQSWHDLLFAHWPLDKAVVRDKVPAGFDLDTFDGQAWLGIIPFHMTNVAPRGLPALPWVSAFPELNVRTYVTVDGKPGIFFFSLDAGNPIAVGTARTLFHLPYRSAAMTVEERDGWIAYNSRRTSGPLPADLAGRYRPTGAAQHALPGTLEYFLTERYCLYTVDGSFRPYRLEVHHAPWPLQPAACELSVNTMADAAGIRLPSMAPLLYFSKRQDMVAFPLERLAASR
jgi:uncharacterized protein YqjF (DUF2071 family)